MNYIRINFDDSAGLNAAYTQLKKLYPRNKIIKSSEEDENRARTELKEAMDIEFKKLGINSEEDFIDWVENAREELWSCGTISIISAMRKLQKDMDGKFEDVGLNTDDDIMDLVREVRAEVELS